MMCVCMSILNRLWWLFWLWEEVMGDRGLEEEEKEEDGCGGGGGEDEDEKGAEDEGEDEDEDRGEGEDVDGVVVVFESILAAFVLSVCLVVLLYCERRGGDI